MSETLSFPGKGPKPLDLRGPEMAAPNDSGGQESERNYRPFVEIQADLEDVVKNPNPVREKELKQERSRLISDARSIGADQGILSTIKSSLVDIQTGNSLRNAISDITTLNIANLENEARGLHGWDDKFEGLINEYREGALRNMRLQYLKKTGAPQPEIDELQRRIDVLNWGIPPDIFRRMPVDLVTQAPTPLLDPSNIEQFTDELARKTAEQQGLLRPHEYMIQAIEGMEYLKSPQRFDPGNEPRFIGLLKTDKQRNEWYVKSTLWIIAWKKNAALDSDQLTMKEMHDHAVELNKWALRIMFGEAKNGEILQEGQDGVLPAAGIYTTIIGDLKFRDWMGQFDQVDSKGDDHRGLYNQDGTPSEINLKRVFFDQFNNSTRRELMADYGRDGVSELSAEAQDLKKQCPDSFYPHSKTWGTNIDADGFKALRSSIRFWLVTKGRDLLLTETERQNRDEFFSNPRALDILKFRAWEAEVVAWNFSYIVGTLESFDSEDYRPEKTKRHSPSGFWSLPLWTTMHLQERFLQKVFRTSPENDAFEGKEEWAGSLGTWALNNFDDPKEVPQILPKTTFRGGLFNRYVYEARRDPDGKPSTRLDAVEDDENYPALFTKFNDIGKACLDDTKPLPSRADLIKEINWDRVSDTPFVSYIWDETRWGNVVEKSFKKGRGSDMSLQDLGEAVRNLVLPRQSKEKLLIIYNGVNVRRRRLTPFQGWISWIVYDKPAILQQFPNYFKER